MSEIDSALYWFVVIGFSLAFWAPVFAICAIILHDIRKK